ncbi:MAG TPA: alpha/beta hydrolase [Thermoanaerobaculia bacterium]
MKAILVHGMGRSPLSQLLLAKRLCSFGIGVDLFGYSTFRPFDVSLNRLVKRALALDEPFILVGHSLGCVLIRAALPRLTNVRPSACFFLAPPNKVPRAARFFGRNRLSQLLTGGSGRLLSNDDFMAALPVPECPVRVYAGTAGYTGRLSPFRYEPNDGILAVSETVLSPSNAPVLVPVLHTFIMNSKVVARDIASTVASLGGQTSLSEPASRTRRHPGRRPA